MVTWTHSWWPNWSASRQNGEAALPELREAIAADVPALLEVFFHAMEDLDERRRRPLQPRNAAPLEMHFEHLLATDPHSSIVADDHGRVVAFGIVMRRGPEAFLSFLFVEPRWQGRGLGRAVLDTCIAGAGDVERMATCAEADQPVSTGLYASLGLAPRAPIYLVRGGLREHELPELPEGINAQRVEQEAVDALDRELVGYSRPQDHLFWARGDRQGWMLTAGHEVVGYGYAHRSGRIGPVAAIEPNLLPVLLGHLARNTQVLEGRQLVLPGPCIVAFQALLRAGLRIDGTPAVYCAQGPGPRLDRYIPMSFALL
jgi:GNAT superfamily N-acetyltransferase